MARRLALLLSLLLFVGCNRELTPETFRREAERAYLEVNKGWGIVRRDGMHTVFVRGDQVDTLDCQSLFDRYKQSGQSGSAWLETWTKEQEALIKARRKSLDQAKDLVLPILKSSSWVRVQDVGAIAPKDVQDQIKPWRKQVVNELYVLLGVPEERLGFRFASIEEVRTAADKEDVQLERAIANLRGLVGTATGAEMRNAEGRLLVYDLSGTTNVAGLILDPKFRTRMLEHFNREELGAAVPIRDVLIVFDSSDFVAVRPVRARTHQLYDTQNHPGFRGLLRFDSHGLGVLEGAEPNKKQPQE